MRMLLTYCAGLVLAATTAQAQTKHDPAKLLSPKTALYIESTNLGDLAAEIRSLFKGSCLYDMPQSIQKLREKHARKDGRRNYMLYSIMPFGLMISEDAVKEAKRSGGGSIAFTGKFTPRDGPEFLATLYPGESTYPTMFMRAMMSTPEIRSIAKVKGVSIYQNYSRIYYDKDFKKGERPREPEYRAFGPAMALTANTVLIGSPKLVTDALKRRGGLIKTKSLADDKRFQEVRARTGKDGLFVYSGLASWDDFRNMFGGADPGPVVTSLLPLKAMRGWGVNLNLKDGALSYKQHVLLSAKEESPLAALLSGKSFDPTLLQFIPNDAIVTAGFATANAKGWNKFLALADNNLPAGTPVNFKISTLVKNLEKNLGVQFGADVFDNVTDVAFAVGNPMTAPRERLEERGPGYRFRQYRRRVPFYCVVRAKTAASAAKLTKLLPGVCSLMVGKKVDATKNNVVIGQEVYTMDLGKFVTVSYGRVGNTIVIGPYHEHVAMALAAGKAKSGLYGSTKTALLIAKGKKSDFIMLARPTAAIAGLPFLFEYNKGGYYDDGKGEKPGAPGGQQKVVTRQIMKQSKRDREMIEGFQRVFAKENPLVLTARRKGNTLHIDGSVTGLRQFVPALVDYAVEQAIRPYDYDRKDFKGEFKEEKK